MQIITKPMHDKYILKGLDNSTYVKYANVYAGCKRWGVREYMRLSAE